MTGKITLKGRKVVGGKAQGEALVCQEAITFLGGVNPLTGVVTESGHQLEGQSMAGKVLVFSSGKGSTGNSYQIYDMTDRGTGPVAFIQISAEPISTIGAIMANIPLIDACDRNPTEVIRSGDYVEVDADAGTVAIIKKD